MSCFLNDSQLIYNFLSRYIKVCVAHLFSLGVGAGRHYGFVIELDENTDGESELIWNSMHLMKND